MELPEITAEDNGTKVQICYSMKLKIKKKKIIFYFSVINQTLLDNAILPNFISYWNSGIVSLKVIDN